MASVSGQELPPIPPNIGVLVGPALIGIFMNWFLYGILVMQLYVYYQWFPDDRRMIKCLVYGLFILDTMQTFIASADAFHWFARGFGNLNILSQPFNSPFDIPILDGIIAFVVQSFFCSRIRVLQKSWWLPLVILGVSITGLAGAMAVGVKEFMAADLYELYTLKWQLPLWLGASALADVLIAIVMTYVLLRSRSKDYEQTNNILAKIVRLTVETNIVTASIAIVGLVVFLTVAEYPRTTMATPAYALGKLYSNTLLAIFNNRIYMKRGMSPVFGTMNFHYPAENQTREASSVSVEMQPGEPHRLEIQVLRQVEKKVLPQAM